MEEQLSRMNCIDMDTELYLNRFKPAQPAYWKLDRSLNRSHFSAGESAAASILDR